MEAWGYIVVGLFLLLLLFVANLIRVVIRHRRVVREAHRARASSMLQGAASYLDHAGEKPEAVSAPPVEQERPLVPDLPSSTLESDFGLALRLGTGGENLAEEPAGFPAPAPPESESTAPEPPAPAPTPSGSEDYSLVAPVELRFSGDGSRVGVKRGTPLQAEFLRIANLLLDDLAASREG